ncbi:MAG: hypothetical protein Alpg2KO_14950 [Alphaproteobacteria bacterium]
MNKFSLAVAGGIIAAFAVTSTPAQAHDGFGVGARTSNTVSKTKVPAMPSWLSSARKARQGSQYDVARTKLEQAARSKSRRSDALREMTQLYAEQGDLDNATATARRLYQHCGANCAAYIDSRLIVSKYGDIERDPVGRLQRYDEMVFNSNR